MPFPSEVQAEATRLRAPNPLSHMTTKHEAVQNFRPADKRNSYKTILHDYGGHILEEAAMFRRYVLIRSLSQGTMDKGNYLVR